VSACRSKGEGACSLLCGSSQSQSCLAALVCSALAVSQSSRCEGRIMEGEIQGSGEWGVGVYERAWAGGWGGVVGSRGEGGLGCGEECGSRCVRAAAN
jgi:hypothetical protein